jgi:hypothetical protein
MFKAFLEKSSFPILPQSLAPAAQSLSPSSTNHRYAVPHISHPVIQEITDQYWPIPPERK